MAREHEAIGNLASTIAAGVGRDDIYEAACREAAHLLGADAGGIAMLSGAGPRTVGTWRAPGADDRLELAIARLGGPAAGGGPEAAAAFAAIGAIELDEGHHAAGAPVMVDGRAWGLIAACRRGPPFGAEDERALARLGALVGTAVGVATSRELLVRQATTDGLTGLLNHRAFHDTLRVEAKRAGRYGRPLAVVLADLDGFKEVNDAHGHQAGDRLLEEVARALEGVLRATEVVARLGGDEFALLLPETSVDRRAGDRGARPGDGRRAAGRGRVRRQHLLRRRRPRAGGRQLRRPDPLRRPRAVPLQGGRRATGSRSTRPTRPTE